MDYASVDTDGMTVETTSMSQADLETQFAPPVAEVKAAGPDAAPAPESSEPPPAADVKPEPAKAKKRDDPVSRMLDATAKEAAAKRERDEAKAEAARYRAELDAARRPAPAPEPPKPDAAQPVAQKDWARYKAMPDAPKIGDFDDYTDFNAALSVFVADQRYAERRQAEHAQAQHARVQHAETEHFQSFQTKIREAVAADPTFLDSIDKRLTETPRLSALPPNQRPTFGNFLVEQIYRSESPKELLQHFTAHPADIQRLSTLPPEHVIREMARIEARFLSVPAASRETGSAAPMIASKARPPITPVGGSASGTSADEASDDESVDAYIRRENAKESRQRRAS